MENVIYDDSKNVKELEKDESKKIGIMLLE
jgi:hypothetical protein